MIFTFFTFPFPFMLKNESRNQWFFDNRTKDIFKFVCAMNEKNVYCQRLLNIERVFQFPFNSENINIFKCRKLICVNQIYTCC